MIAILANLTKILEGVHAAGYVHNDLKTDQVAVTISPTEVNVTLLDLGNMTKIG